MRFLPHRGDVIQARTYFAALLLYAVACGAPAAAQTAPDASNMSLVGSNNLNGASGGEGFAMKIADRTTAKSIAGHRYLYVASEENGDPVACFSVVDVENGAHPVVKVQVPISLGGVNPGQPPRGTPDQRKALRCNSLDVAGDTLAVAQEVSQAGLPGAGVLFYNIEDPAFPKLVSYYDTSGGFSKGTHHVWFAAHGKRLWAAGGAGNTHIPSLPGNPFAGQVFVPKRTQLDYNFPDVIDTSDPVHPKEVSRYYYPGVSASDPRPAPDGLPGADSGVRLHNVDVFPSHPDRVFLAMLDGGIVIADLDGFRIREISITRYRGPGFTHTVYPLFGRRLLEVSEEAFGPPPCMDGPKRATVWSIRDERLPVYLGSAPFVDTDRFCPPKNTDKNTGRYGSHNIWESKPYSPGWRSEYLMLDTFFRGGLRVFDIRDPLDIKDVAHYIPAYTPSTYNVGSIQINDVFVDDRGLVYIQDRFGDGLFILRSPLIGCTSGLCYR